MRGKMYDLGGSIYTQEMEGKSIRYESLIRQAERIKRENNGKPTNEEAEFYYQASKVCEEIMSMNNSQRSVYEKWKYLKLDCEANIRRIGNILAPAPVKEEPEAERMAQKVTNKQKKSTGTQVATTSESGFTTKHATKDVPLEKIERWFVKLEEVRVSGFDEVNGREELKKNLMNAAAGFGWSKTDESLQINPAKCYFLYGPPGTGKTFMINAFAKELSKRAAAVDKEKEFSFMQLTGSDIHESYVGIAEKIVKTAFAVAEEHEPCLLFIDEIDNLCVTRDSKAESHERRLTVEFMQAYNKFIKSGKRVVFMGATNYPGRIDPAMLDRGRLIRVPLPTKNDRADFFNQMLDPTKKNPAAAKLELEAGFTIEEMAEATDNHSYRDLEYLRDFMLEELKNQAIEKYMVLDENGKVDQLASDERVSQAILAGKIKISRAVFETAQKENPPKDKTKDRAELQEFEKGIERARG